MDLDIHGHHELSWTTVNIVQNPQIVKWHFKLTLKTHCSHTHPYAIMCAYTLAHKCANNLDICGFKVNIVYEEVFQL